MYTACICERKGGILWRRLMGRRLELEGGGRFGDFECGFC